MMLLPVWNYGWDEIPGATIVKSYIGPLQGKGGCRKYPERGIAITGLACDVVALH